MSYFIVWQLKSLYYVKRCITVYCVAVFLSNINKTGILSFYNMGAYTIVRFAPPYVCVCVVQLSQCSLKTNPVNQDVKSILLEFNAVLIVIRTHFSASFSCKSVYRQSNAQYAWYAWAKSLWWTYRLFEIYVYTG